LVNEDETLAILGSGGPMGLPMARNIAKAARAHGDEDMAATYLASTPRQPAGPG